MYDLHLFLIYFDTDFFTNTYFHFHHQFCSVLCNVDVFGNHVVLILQQSDFEKHIPGLFGQTVLVR